MPPSWLHSNPLAGLGESDAAVYQPEEAPDAWKPVRVGPRFLPALIALVVLWKSAANLFAGGVAPLPRVPWGLGIPSPPL